MASLCWHQACSIPKTCMVHSLEMCYLKKQVINECQLCSYSKSAFLFQEDVKKYLAIYSLLQMGLWLHYVLHTDPMKTIQLPFASPVLHIPLFSYLSGSTEPVIHSYTCPIYKGSICLGVLLWVFLVWGFGFCLFVFCRHSCFLAPHLVSRIVHASVPCCTVRSYPEGRLVQDSFPFE